VNENDQQDDRHAAIKGQCQLALHFLVWLVLDKWFDWPAIVEDIAERPFITLGMVALLMLLALAVTSTRGWMRRLGGRWQQLHRLVYPAAILGCWHYWWQVKADWREPLVYSLALALLLAWRLRRWQRRQRAVVSAPGSSVRERERPAG